MAARRGTIAAVPTLRRLVAPLAAALALATLPALPPFGSAEVHAATTVGGTYHPLTPTRILDTRIGTGGFSTPLGPAGSIDVTVGGRGGVPASGVSAVV